MKQSNNRGHFRGRSNGAVRRNNNSSFFSGISINTPMDSNGPCGKIRGNAFQIMEKYLSASKDALSSDDRILAERCLQHAEHYFRLHSQFLENEEQRKPIFSSDNQAHSEEVSENTDEDTTVSGIEEVKEKDISEEDSGLKDSFFTKHDNNRPRIKKVRFSELPVLEDQEAPSSEEEDTSFEEIKPLEMDLSFPDLSKLEQTNSTENIRPKRRYTPRVKKTTSVA